MTIIDSSGIHHNHIEWINIIMAHCNKMSVSYGWRTQHRSQMDKLNDSFISIDTWNNRMWDKLSVAYTLRWNELFIVSIIISDANDLQWSGWRHQTRKQADNSNNNEDHHTNNIVAIANGCNESLFISFGMYIQINWPASNRKRFFYLNVNNIERRTRTYWSKMAGYNKQHYIVQLVSQ